MDIGKIFGISEEQAARLKVQVCQTAHASQRLTMLQDQLLETLHEIVPTAVGNLTAGTNDIERQKVREEFGTAPPEYFDYVLPGMVDFLIADHLAESDGSDVRMMVPCGCGSTEFRDEGSVLVCANCDKQAPPRKRSIRCRANAGITASSGKGRALSVSAVISPESPRDLQDK